MKEGKNPSLKEVTLAILWNNNSENNSTLKEIISKLPNISEEGAKKLLIELIKATQRADRYNESRIKSS